MCWQQPIVSNKAACLLLFLHIHTYIIGHCNPSVRIIDLLSHTTYVVCVNFIHKRRDLQFFKVVSERQIFWETFHGHFIYSPSFCQKSAERKSPKKYFSYFVLMSGLGLEPWLFVTLTTRPWRLVFIRFLFQLPVWLIRSPVLEK